MHPKGKVQRLRTAAPAAIADLRGRLTLKTAWLALFMSGLAAAAGAELRVGTGLGDITPPIGTPSAGYGNRRGAGMTGVHDRLLATAMLIDNGERPIALVGVDHLGFTYEMVQQVRQAVADDPLLSRTEIYVGSSHTHAGGGAFLNVPGIGETLAGKYDPAAVKVYVDGTAEALRKAAGELKPARVGLGYGRLEGLNGYRGDWPPNVPTLPDVAVIKAVGTDGSPLAAFFNFAAHPTVLSGANMLFSADFVGYAREHVGRLIGGDVQPVFFNGAQGDVSPRSPGGEDAFARCDSMGRALAVEVKRVWDATPVAEALKIETLKETYTLEPKPTSAGLLLPLPPQPTEMNALVFNDRHAFVSVPGELSCIYDADIKRFGGWLGFEHVSILGLTNDAHGYLITPESWRHMTYESTVSFGGELYGEMIKNTAFALLHALEPEGAYQADRAKPSSILTPAPAPAAAP